MFSRPLAYLWPSEQYRDHDIILKALLPTIFSTCGDIKLELEKLRNDHLALTSDRRRNQELESVRKQIDSVSVSVFGTDERRLQPAKWVIPNNRLIARPKAIYFVIDCTWVPTIVSNVEAAISVFRKYIKDHDLVALRRLGDCSKEGVLTTTKQRGKLPAIVTGSDTTPFQLKGGGRVPPPRQGGLYLGTADEKSPPTTEELNRAHSDVEAKLETCKAYFTDGSGPGSPAVYQTVIDVVELLKKSQDAREHSKWLVILTDTADIHRCDQNGNPADDLGQLKQNARDARKKIDELRAAAKRDDGEQFKVREPTCAPRTLPSLTLTWPNRSCILSTRVEVARTRNRSGATASLRSRDLTARWWTIRLHPATTLGPTLATMQSDGSSGPRTQSCSLRGSRPRGSRLSASSSRQSATTMPLGKRPWRMPSIALASRWSRAAPQTSRLVLRVPFVPCASYPLHTERSACCACSPPQGIARRCRRTHVSAGAWPERVAHRLADTDVESSATQAELYPVIPYTMHCRLARKNRKNRKSPHPLSNDQGPTSV